jgi:outer membrane protein OmpA-like peptidoglycan-associated protein
MKMKHAIAAVAVMLACAAGIGSAQARCSPPSTGGKTWEPVYVYFQTGSATINPPERKKIVDHAKLAKANYIQKICVTGTTDKQGDARANARLSKQRATAVASELRKQGIAASVIETEAAGEPGGSWFGGLGASSADRRVEIRFTK